MSPEKQRVLISAMKGPKADALLEGMSRNKKKRSCPPEQPNELVIGELMQQVAASDYSERQLDEVLTDFWFTISTYSSTSGCDRILLTSTSAM